MMSSFLISGYTLEFIVQFLEEINQRNQKDGEYIELSTNRLNIILKKNMFDQEALQGLHKGMLLYLLKSTAPQVVQSTGEKDERGNPKYIPLSHSLKFLYYKENGKTRVLLNHLPDII